MVWEGPDVEVSGSPGQDLFPSTFEVQRWPFGVFLLLRRGTSPARHGTFTVAPSPLSWE
jgi:hypothetical protein